MVICCGEQAMNNQPIVDRNGQNKDKFFRIFQMLPDAVVLARAIDSVILEVNEAFTELTGYASGEIVGKTFQQLVSFLDPELWAEVFRTLAESGEVRNIETRMLRKDGQIAFVLACLRSLESEGQPCCLITFHDLVGRKSVHTAAQGQQSLPEYSLDNLISPAVDINREEIGSLIDFEAIQDLMNSFYNTTRIPMAIIDLKGNVQVATGWQDICTGFHRIHPETLALCKESDTYFSQNIGEGKYTLYKCRNNMWDMATPIIISGRYIANLFMGQFFFDDEVPDYELFRKQAERYGFDVEEYLAAVDRVPRWSRETVGNAMEFYTKLAVMISRLSFSNIMLARTLAEQERVEEALRISEQKYRTIIENAPLGIFRSTVDGRFVSVNPTLAAMMGYDSPEELLQTCNNSTIHDVLYVDPEARNATVETVLRDGGWQVRENRYCCKDGRIITGNLYMRAAPTPGNGGSELEGFVEDITERNQAEEELHKANLVVENSPVVLFRWKAEEGWPVEYVSRNVTQFGYRPEEFLAGAIPFAAIVHPDDLERVSAEVREYSLQGIDQFRQEFRILSKEGKVRWIDDHTVIERDAAGIITHYQGIVIDITDRKRAEDELQLTQLCVDKALIGVHRVDPDGKVVFANEYMSRCLGYSREELCTMSIFDIDPTLTLSGWAEHRQNVYAAGSKTFESIHRRKDGTTFPVEVTVNHFDFKGKGVAFSFSMDISVRKRAEKALRESEEKFRVLAETSPVGIALYQGERLIYTNPAIECMLGYTKEELARMRFWDWVHEDFRESVRKRSLARLRGEQASRQYECRFVKQDGESRWAIISAGLIELMGKPAGILTLIDVTDARQAEEQVRSSLAEKEILLKEIHHRVKNNLQIVSTLLELQSDYITDDDSLKFFRESQDRIRSMALVHEKLYKTKDFSLIDFQGYIESLTNYLFRSYITDPKQVVFSVAAGNVALGIDDAIPCGLIINELVSNSLKYAFPEGRQGGIAVNFQAEDQGWIVLTVADNGIGLPDGLDFTDTETLGLQLVNMLVKQLRGVVALRNDHGAVFTIKFKCKHSDDSGAFH